MQSRVAIGEVFAGFRVEALIGEGAMGAVYLARDTRQGRRIALKVLAPELARDERFRQRFLRESELAASLDHPHIVSTVGTGEPAGTVAAGRTAGSRADARPSRPGRGGSG